jgi:hypothetical protein
LLKVSKDCVKRVEHLKYRFVRMFFDAYARAKGAAIRRRVKHNCCQSALSRTLLQRYVYLPHHGDVQDINGRARQRNAGHAIVYSKLYVVERA